MEHEKNKCKKHKINKTVDLGGVMFCKKCLEEGSERIKATVGALRKKSYRRKWKKKNGII
jgi:translation elongation factor EF-Ts